MLYNCFMSKQHSNSKQEEMEKRYLLGESIAEIARTMGLYTTSVSRVLDRRGIKKREVNKKESHPMWKGGHIIKTGYPASYRAEHPRRMNIPYVYDHILEWEKHTGYIPKRSEPIHHIDLDRMNSDFSNLHLCKTNSEHQLLHSSLNKCVSVLIKKGILKYKDGAYYM